MCLSVRHSANSVSLAAFGEPAQPKDVRYFVRSEHLVQAADPAKVAVPGDAPFHLISLTNAMATG